jgi:tetratricopeptide (TPR) repeat protein
LFVLSANAQSDDPFATESSDWPDIDSETPAANEPAATPQSTPAPKKGTPPPPTQPAKSDIKPTSQPSSSSSLSSNSSSSTSSTVAPTSQTPSSSTSSTSSMSSTAQTPSSSSTESSSYSSSKSSDSEPEQTSRTSYVSSNTMLKRAGPPRILVCRPVYAPYSEETKTMYISSITEAYFHFKLNALPGYQVIPIERVANNVQYFRDFSRRISRTSYIDAAQQLGATYLFYIEYEPQGKKVKFNVEFYSITENKKLVSSVQQVDLANFEDGLFNCLNEVISALPEKFSDEIQKLLGSSILGKNTKSVETLGNLVASMGNYTKGRAANLASEYERIAQSNDFYLAKMVASEILTLAGKVEVATQLMDNLINQFGRDYPALYLELASMYRQALRYNDALDAAEKAARSQPIALLANTEKAHIYEAKGDLRAAKNEYLSVLSSGGEDGEIYFQLALVSIGLNDLSSSSTYISKAEAAGRKIDRSDYYDIGLRYKNLGTADEKAVEAFKNSLGIQQDKEEAWLQLAEVYSKMGKEDEAAECYVNLFHINNSAYKDYLPKAGYKFEALGMKERAKETYSLFIARKYTDPEVSIRLAKLELADNNCPRATELVQGLDTNTYGSDISKIYDQCGIKQRHVVINDRETKQQRGKAAVFMWRVLSGIVAAGGAGTGFYINSLIDNKIAEYKSHTDTWLSYLNDPQGHPGISPKDVQEERDFINTLHSDIESFKLYRNACYGVGGVGATSFTLSIVIPIIAKK